MTNPYVNAVIAHYLNKQSAEMPEGMPEGMPEDEGHEAAESPDTEMLEHAMGGSEHEMGEGGEGGDVEELLAQLSPEELEQLAQALSGEMQNPEQHEGGEDVAHLAQAIQGHLGENPEAMTAPGMPPEKAAAFDMIKSASYIEGFINQALVNGISVKQAVDLYDQALTETVEALSKTAAGGRKARRAREQAAKAQAAKAQADKAQSAPKSSRALALVERSSNATKAQSAPKSAPKSAPQSSGTLVRGGKATATSRVSEAAGNFARQAGERARRAGQYIRTRPGRAGLAAAGTLATVGAGAYAMSGGKKDKAKADEQKTAAYCEGIFKSAIEYGFSEDEAVQIVHETLSKVSGAKDLAEKYIAEPVKSFAKKHLAGPSVAAAGVADSVGKKVYEHRGKLSATAAGLAGVAAGRASRKDSKDSESKDSKDKDSKKK